MHDSHVMTVHNVYVASTGNSELLTINLQSELYQVRAAMASLQTFQDREEMKGATIITNCYICLTFDEMFLFVYQKCVRVRSWH